MRRGARSTRRPVAPLTAEPIALASLCLVLVWLPLAAGIPAWIAATAACAACLRVALASYGRDALAALPRSIIAAIAIGAFFMQYHGFGGLAAGTALLALTAGLKVLEARSSRDLYVVVLIVYFLALAALLTRQTPATFAYLLAVATLATATLLRSGSRGEAPGRWSSLGYTARLVATALPLAIAAWLFFPRLAAPLWRIVPAEAGAQSGLGDTLDPGDIDALALSDAIAFHARFLGPTPPRGDLYWRGPVLDGFDGRVWHRDDRGYAPPGEGRGGTLYRVRLELEPYPHDWLIGLDRPESADLADVRRTTDGLLVLPGRRSPPQEVVITSRLGAEPLPQESLPTQLRRRDLGYPPGRDPRTGAFAGELRRLHPQDLDLVAAVLAMFHQEPFYYTLTPPQLGRDAVDEFLFVTRRGFCEHYASAFAALMRAAGIPARVVTGYYGGRYNGYSQEWIVRQSDAHAWDEIWLAGRGWVRVDPTAAIDPARIDPGLRDLARTPGGFAASTAGAAGWTADLELRFDALRMLWRDRILNYDSAAQRALLSGLGVARPDDAGLAAALALSFALGLAWLAFESRRALAVRPRDELQRAFRRLEARLARIGLPRLPHEGPQAYAKRVGERRADLAGEVARLCAEYAALRYGPATSSARVRALAAAVRSFRPRRSRGWRENRSPPSAPR